MSPKLPNWIAKPLLRVLCFFMPNMQVLYTLGIFPKKEKKAKKREEERYKI
jgi:hypothetical protein